MKTSREKLSVKIDYLSIVFHSLDCDDVIDYILNMKYYLFEKKPGRIKHKPYNVVYQMGNIKIYTFESINEEEQEIAGCYLTLSGEGCDQLDMYLKWQKRDWKDLFQTCINLCTEKGFHLTRLDVAIDDRNEKPFFTVDQLARKCQKDQFLSNSELYDYREKKFRGDDTIKLLYIGAQKSDILYRFYDKDKDEAKKHNIPTEEITTWKRTEMQFRDDIAHGFALNLLANKRTLGQQAFDFLSTNLNFLVEDKSQEDKKKWKKCRYWERFLGEVEYLKITVKREKTSIYETQEWMIHGGVLAAVKAFEFLEQHQALQGLKSIQEMKNEVFISEDLSSKLVSHLSLMGKEDCIPLVYAHTKK